MAKLNAQQRSQRTKKGWQKRERAKPKAGVADKFRMAANLSGARLGAKDNRGPALPYVAPPAKPGPPAGYGHTERAAQTGRNPQFGTSGNHKREVYLDTYAQVPGMSRNDLTRGVTRSRLSGSEGPSLSPADTDMGEVKRVRSADRTMVSKAMRDAGWQSAPGLYASDEASLGRYKAPADFIETEMAPSHKRWMDRQRTDPNSPFNANLKKDADGNVINTTKGQYSPGQRNRIKLYTDALQEGASHDEALSRLDGERRGRKAMGQRPGEDRNKIAKDTLGARTSGRSGKYQSSTPTPSGFSVGVSSANADSLNELKQKMPGAPERELIRTQQYQRMYLGDQINQNQAWAHETRRSNIMGNKTSVETPDRVVFFTTSLGSPAPSVPSDSLVGQYIIRKRVNAAKKMGISKGSLNGRFPEAVRDMHVFEASTGLSLGVEGRIGVFQKTGYRKGAKASQGFGKPTPVGQQVLYDQSGRAMYDSNGNIRYTEGGTRPFKLGTDSDLGFRVFIG